MKEKFMYEKLTKKRLLILPLLFCFILTNSNVVFAQDLFDDDFLGSSVPEVAPLPSLKAEPKAKDIKKVAPAKKEKAPSPKITKNLKKEDVPSIFDEPKKEKKAETPLEKAKKALAEKKKKQNKQISKKIEKPKTIDKKNLPKSNFNTKKQEMVFSSIQKTSSKRPSQALLGKVSTELFRQMADIERQNALLALQLKREGLRSEIEAIKRQRRISLQEEISKKEADKRKQTEWENKQAQEKLEASKKIEDEKNKLMIEQLTKNLAETKQNLNAQIHSLKAEKEQQILTLREEKERMINDLKLELEKAKTENARTKRNANAKIMALAEAAKKKGQQLAQAAKKTTSTQRKQISDLKRKLQSKIREINSLNKKNIELIELKETEKQNAIKELQDNMEEDDTNSTIGMDIVNNYDNDQTPVEELYAVLEVKGSKKNIVAKLLTKDGLTFMVKRGTLLSSGHKVVDIQRNHIKVSKAGRLEMIGFPAGGVLDREPTLESVMSKKIIGENNKNTENDDWAPEPEASNDNDDKKEEDLPPPSPYVGNSSGVPISRKPRMPGMR